MLTKNENEQLCRVGPGTPMGELFRQYWLPALRSSEFPAPDSPPKRMRLLGENLVMFRDRQGRMGALAEACPHRGASLYFGRNEECGLRCAYHGWNFDGDVDVDALGLVDGGHARVNTKRGSAEVMVEISPTTRRGHISLPNGLGVTETSDAPRGGVAPNQLTSSDHRDPIAGTPFHKHVPVRLAAVIATGAAQ